MHCVSVHFVSVHCVSLKGMSEAIAAGEGGRREESRNVGLHVLCLRWIMLQLDVQACASQRSHELRYPGSVVVPSTSVLVSRVQ